MQIVLPDGANIATTAIPNSSYAYLGGSTYYALVPADTTAATVTLEPNQDPAAIDPNQAEQSNGQFNPTATTVSLAAPVSTTVDLPAPYQPPTPTPPTSNAAKKTAPPAHHASAPPAHHRASSASPLVWLVPLIVVTAAAVTAAAWWWRRRRRVILPARPVVWPPRQLGAAATAVLRPAPPAALEPGASGELGRGWAAELGPAPTVAGEPPVLVINLLGPLQVDGLAKKIKRSPERRMLVVLAVTPERPLSVDELALAISDDPDRTPKTASMHSYASGLRHSLPEGVFPEAAEGGYHLDPSLIVVDWVCLARVANQPTDTPGWAELARGALELVRGRPLEGCSWEGVEPLVRAMQAGVENLAHTLAGYLLAAGDPAGAEWAVGRGLLALGNSHLLWQDRLDAAAAGSGYGLERAWTDTQAALGADAALLAGRYQQLRRGLEGRPTAST